MYQARDLMAGVDPTQSQPMSSAIWKQDAMAFMEQCKFKEAAYSFVQTRRILEKLQEKGAIPISAPSICSLSGMDWR